MPKTPRDRRTNSNLEISQIFRACILDERIIEVLIEKALTNQLAAITCPSNRFYGQLPKQWSNLNRSMRALPWQQLKF